MNVKTGRNLGCNDRVMAECRNLRGVNKVKKQDRSPGLWETGLCPIRGSAWKNPTRYSLGKKKGPEELVVFQGSPLPSSGMVYPDVQ